MSDKERDSENMCVYERERQRLIERMSDKKRERECVCVCVCVCERGEKMFENK